MKKNKTIFNFVVLAGVLVSIVLAPIVSAEVPSNSISDGQVPSNSLNNSPRLKERAGISAVRRQNQDQGQNQAQNQGQEQNQNKGQGLGAATAGIGNQNFCTKFDTLSQKFSADIKTKAGDLQGKIGTESQKAQANRLTADNTMKQDRAKGVQNRQVIYARLNSKAITDAQKQAVATFQTTLEAAVTAREAAVDAARTTYRQSFDQLVSQHQTTADTTLTTFQTAVQAAIAQASGQCAGGVAPATVRDTFQAAMQAARSARQTGTGKTDSIATQLQQLAQTRNAAIQSALQTYQTAMQAAVGTLKVAFGQSATADSSATTPAAIN